jgi:hypothetical protein
MANKYNRTYRGYQPTNGFSLEPGPVTQRICKLVQCNDKADQPYPDVVAGYYREGRRD